MVDIIYMPPLYRYKYLILAREDVSSWVKERALTTASFAVVVKFLFKDLVYYYRLFRRLVVNRGPKNKGLIKAFAELYSIQRIVVLAYHP